MRNLAIATWFCCAALLAACSGPATGANTAALPLAAQSRHAQPPVVRVVADPHGALVSSDDFGGSLDTWYDFTQSFVAPSLRGARMHLVRFPGGSESDAYHWENGGSLCDGMGYITPNATFDHLMEDVAQPLHIDIAITLNYGSNLTCNGGGEPSEAGAWVAYAKSKGYNVRYWTVGNEVYGSWEYDLHTPAHDPTTYSNAVRTGYYPAVKAADASVKLGVVVDTPNDTAWNDVVLKQAAPFDFVELHYYPEYTASASQSNDNDAFLLGPAIEKFASDLAGLRKQMTAAGVASSVPIYLGEYNSDAGTMGKQSVSIVNGLFLGQMIGTAINAGVPMATWWVAYGSCDQSGGDYSSSLYGWQNFGSEALFSDGLPDSYEGCATTPTIPGGTPFPPARVLSLYAHSVPAGSRVAHLAYSAGFPQHVRAYAYTTEKGAVLVLFNDTLSPVALDARLGYRGTARLATYDKSDYDLSKNNVWAGPTSRSLGAFSGSAALTLPPYSMSVLSIE
ncbi:MAG TPA: hypothetical protein VMH02_00990 [Verrucomicrobiae bacterium]|nr:hypothetical protein [Verrucomicrobiae bacterium]